MSPWSSIGTRASATFICRCVTRMWLERPQSGETMVTYDLTGMSPKVPEAKQE